MKTPRKRAALRIALKSDNPVVQSALDQLLIVTELAHAEEITEALRPKEQPPFAAQFAKARRLLRQKARIDDWSTGI